jgi:sugar lactone lactonase YvrE
LPRVIKIKLHLKNQHFMKTTFLSFLVLISISIFAKKPETPASGTVTTVTPIGGQAQGLVFNTDETILYGAFSNIFQVKSVTMPSKVAVLAGKIKGSADGVGVAAKFSQAYGIAIHPITGDIYVSDGDSSVIKKINPATGEVTNYTGVVGKSATLNGHISIAKFAGPRGLAFDEKGNLYVGQSGRGAIRKISADGTVSTLVEGGTPAYFKNPWGIAYSKGYLYVSEASGHKISKVDVSNGLVSVLAGSGTAGAEDGVGVETSFNSPRGIAVDANGNVFVADYSNHKIRKISPAGIVTTIAGSGEGTLTDGVGTDAAFKSPAGLVLDKTGYLYVGDAGNNCIRKVYVGEPVKGNK